MATMRLSSVSVAFLLLASGAPPLALADGVCTRRPPTPAETKAYTSAYELFHRVAPAAPEGWTTSDSPSTANMPALCQESGNEPMRRSFQRHFSREGDRQARDQQAMQAYADMAKRQQARQAANQAQIDSIDAKINVLTVQVQQAAAAQRFGDIERLTQQMDALQQQRMALAGYDQLDAQSEQIDAEYSRDTDATFLLSFEVPRNEPRTGVPYRTSAGQAYLSAYEDKGNSRHDVNVYFGGGPQQARVQVSGAPERVRALLDATDLGAIAAFR
jgi:hypothetical protein